MAWDGKLIQQQEKGPITLRSKASPGRGGRSWEAAHWGRETYQSAHGSHAGGGEGSPSSQGPAEASGRGRKRVTNKLGGVQTCPTQRTNTL